MRIAIIGGGINGVMVAWTLAASGHKVDLYERGQLMCATSSASTKLLHGGIRYLEQGHWHLVQESLRERAWWLRKAPHLTRPIELFIPLYRHSRRPRWEVKIGLMWYDFLAGQTNIGRHRYLDREELIALAPSLNPKGLIGGFSFFDVQMDDKSLGLWAARQAMLAGVQIFEESEVEHCDTKGAVEIQGRQFCYDRVVNVSGPWAYDLLIRSRVSCRFSLDLVRGSHIVLDCPLESSFLLEVPDERRICFVLSYQGRTLVGTTEIRQSLTDRVLCSKEEEDYLLRVYNYYFLKSKGKGDVYERFSGIRPLIRSNNDPGKATRDYLIERNDNLITVFGGKWTTSRVLSAKVASKVTGKGKWESNLLT